MVSMEMICILLLFFSSKSCLASELVDRFLNGTLVSDEVRANLEAAAVMFQPYLAEIRAAELAEEQAKKQSNTPNPTAIAFRKSQVEPEMPAFDVFPGAEGIIPFLEPDSEEFIPHVRTKRVG